MAEFLVEELVSLDWVSGGVLSVVIHLPLRITHHSLLISHYQLIRSWRKCRGYCIYQERKMQNTSCRDSSMMRQHESASSGQ